MNKQEFETYLRQLCKDKNYDEAKTKKVVERELSNFDTEDGSIFSDLAELPIKSSADYNKKVDELKAKATSLDIWFQTADGEVRSTKSELQKAKDRAAKYESKFGDIDEVEDLGDGKVKTPTGDVLKASDVDRLLRERDQYHLSLTADLGDIRARHARMFKGEIISDREILRKIGEAASDPLNPKQLTADQAYEALYGDRVKQYEADSVKSNEQRLRDEGAKSERERLARSGMKTGAAIGETGIVFNALNSEGKPNDANRQLSDEDRIAQLAQDMSTEFAKNDAVA